MATEFTIEANPADAEYLRFTDISTGVTWADIEAVRLVFGEYPAYIAPVTMVEGDSLELYREYQLTSLTPITLDSKTIVAMEVFVPAVTGLTVPANCTIVTTGNFCKYIPPATYLPAATYNIFTRTPEDIGDEGTVLEDMVRYLTYQTFVASASPTEANGQYLIKGTSGTATYNGNTYRPGEFFIASDASAVVLTGDCELLTLSGIRFRYFTTVWNLTKSLSQLQLSATCETTAKLRSMWDTLRAIQYSDIQNRTSATLTNSILIDLQRQISILENCEND